MKINLLLYDTEQLAGYANIKHDNLNDMADDGELEELRAIDILPYFPANNSEKILSGWVAKIAHHGKIIIGFYDLIEIAKGISKYDLDIDTANNYLYGNDKDLKKASFTISQVSSYLESKGLKITKKRIDDYRCVVEAQRP